jgi:manganese/zinc/iron transport system permease protein
MSQMELFWTLDFPAAASAVLASVLCAVLGCFLLVRRSAMLGDAISHAILPGIVGSFLLVGTRSTWAMLAGAAVAGVVTSSLVDLLHRRLKLERSAATGAVFCTMFSLGVIMLEQGSRNVDLDADCVLYGLLEGISWPALGKAVAAGDGVPGLGAVVQSLGGAPRQLVTLAVALAVTVLVLASLYKVMLLASFDAALADALGFRSRVIDMVFAALVAVAAVASFEAVGSILVVAMLVCPAATAWCLPRWWRWRRWRALRRWGRSWWWRCWCARRRRRRSAATGLVCGFGWRSCSRWWQRWAGTCWRCICRGCGARVIRCWPRG